LVSNLLKCKNQAEASRRGKDKDGRHYVIKIFAENEAGITESEILNAVVPHDQRDKKN